MESGTDEAKEACWRAWYDVWMDLDLDLEADGEPEKEWPYLHFRSIFKITFYFKIRWYMTIVPHSKAEKVFLLPASNHAVRCPRGTHSFQLDNFHCSGKNRLGWGELDILLI